MYVDSLCTLLRLLGFYVNKVHILFVQLLCCLVLHCADNVLREFCETNHKLLRSNKGPSTYYITKKCQFFNTPYPI